MRFRLANPASANYLNTEVYLNNIKLISVNSGSELVMGVAIVDDQGNQVSFNASTATTSSVSGSASSQTLLSANTSRKGCILFNDSAAIAYVKFGATATTSDFTIRLTPYGSYEMNGPIYTGRIDCIWASATGAMRITELT